MYACYVDYIIICINVLHHMQVWSRGYVSLKNGYYYSCWGPQTFPYRYGYYYSPNHAIAAFWHHRSLTNTSAVYYQVFLRQEKESLFKQIDDTIYKQTSQECGSFRFEAQWALIVTWDGIRGYGRYHAPWLPDTVSILCVCVCVYVHVYAYVSIKACMFVVVC